MSFTPAKTIESSQKACHKDLDLIVTKHLKHPYKKPIASHTIDAFNEFEERWLALDQPNIILDSACGTGMSTRLLSEIYAKDLVVGLDQSQKRLAHSDNRDLKSNCLLFRCDCTDFWRLLDKRDIKLKKHYLLYPNPYPKPQHLKRRWHGHPSFLNLINISPKIELRTNWKIYAEEFLNALQISGVSGVMDECGSELTMTAFEHKYKKSGHDLWRVMLS